MRLGIVIVGIVLWGLAHVDAWFSNEKNSETFFSRLKSYQLVNINNRELNNIDGLSAMPSYPHIATLEFEAYGQYYKIQIKKNVNLIPQRGLRIQSYGYDEKKKKRVITTSNYTQEQLCFYNGEVLSDTSGKSIVVMSACRGDGIRGWIHAFGEQLFIKPARLIMDPTYRGKHKIFDQHIVYRDSDVHSIDKPPIDHHCGHDHPQHAEFVERDRKNGRTYMNDESYRNLLLHSPVISSDVVRNTSDSHHSHSSTNTQRRRLSSTNNRYVELLVVNDVPRYQRYNDEDELVKSDLAIVNQVSTLYLNNEFGSNVGEIHVVLTEVVHWTTWTGLENFKPIGYKKSNGDSCDPTSYCSNCGSICEASYDDYLSNFHQWRTSEAPSHDNAHLFSYYDFVSSVIGYATLPGMCIQQSSGGIEQATYDDAYNGNILAHEMGHNWKMSHDSSSINNCDPNAYIMSAVGDPNGARPTEFSSCSISSVQDFFNSYSSTLACVNNLPYSTQYAVCGNGFIEQGETCDCGSSDCSATDPCCDGELCQLYVGADCSSNDECCDNNCKFKSSTSICRALDPSNSCDISVEYCTGTSATCPHDTFKIEGESCANNTGYCYNGRCSTIENQCEVKGDLYGGGNSYVACSNYGNQTYYWKTPTCDKLKCVLNSGGSCNIISNSVTYDKGTPCISSSYPNQPTQCYNGVCVPSTQIYTYKWVALDWDECSKECKANEDDPAGIQNRTVVCTRQNGQQVSASLCNGTKPVTWQYCNGYECNFCRETTTGERCKPNGSCNKAKNRCDCNYGYDGENCDVIPGLKWIGVTRRVFVKNDVTYAWRVDPYNKYNNTNDSNSVVTVAISGVSSITNFTLGDTVSIRWNSTGKLQYLAVGLWDRKPTSWVKYVGKGIATDKQNCDDPYLIRSECDDFSFQIPTDIPTGIYQIVVRFNNEHTIYSEPLEIMCSDDVCGSAGNGECSSTDLLSANCSCTNNWFGPICDQYLCSNWSFAREGADAYTDPITYPRCVNMESSTACNAAASTTNDLCSCSVDSLLTPKKAHFEGTYCEVPIDTCGTLTNKALCNTESNMCIYNGTCVYKDCLAFSSDICGDSPVLELNESIPEDRTWDCQWDTTNNKCVRKSCPIGNLGCARGAVRRPLYDTHSICDYWYCDCSTASDVATTYYKIPTRSELGAVDFANLDSDSDEAKMLTCQLCTLNCENGGSPNEDCNSCGTCTYPWGGLLCDEKYWVISMRLNVDWETAYAYKKEEFEKLFAEDMAYVINVNPSRLGIWQLKGDGDGTVVYWTYTFTTGDDVDAQAQGGSMFTALKIMVEGSGSPVYRGWISNETDSSYSLEYCIPGKEECDPGQQFNYLKYFIISISVSVAFHILALLAYRFLTRKKRRERYEAKLREVREHQIRTMESHARARRVGLKDVSKSRASQIYQAKQEKKKEEEQELKDRVKQEKAMHKRASIQKHNPQHSQEELQERLMDSQIAVANTSAPPAFADPAANLPPGWQVFYNADNIPYYYNANTGVTSWRPPGPDEF